QGLRAGADRAQRHQREGRLADAGLAAHEDERRGHEPAAENAVELRDTRRDPLRLLRVDLDEPEQRTGGSRLLAGRRRALLDEAPECGAARTSAEPPARRISALAARIEDGRLRHATTVRARADTICSNFVPS